MTADGVLYLDEDCRDAFEDKLDKVFGKGKWVIDASKYSDCWDLANIPEAAEVDIVSSYDNKKLGTALFFEI